jgi:hypothetical protein
MDTIVEYRNGTKKTSIGLHKDDELSSSQSSLGSNLSRTPNHSRHNSKGSLPEMMEGSRRSSSQTPYTGAGNQCRTLCSLFTIFFGRSNFMMLHLKFLSFFLNLISDTFFFCLFGVFFFVFFLVWCMCV